LNKFDLSSIVSDIGGLRLDRMFPGLRVPNVARDSIKITQGFDKEKLIAWVKADLHMKLPSKADLLNYGPLVVSLDDAQITGHTHLEASLESQIKKSNYGELSGSWNISVGGMPLMIFRETKVIFRNGKTTIDLDPKRMEMPGILDMIHK